MQIVNSDDDRRASEVLYKEIVASKNSLRRNNIEALKKVCDLMEKDGVPISLAEVVRRTGEHGPKYSTVSNKGSSLGEYVRLRISEQTARTTKPAHDARSSVADFLQDPVLQARVRDTESVARYIKRENVALRSLLKNLSPGVDIDRVIASGPNSSGAVNIQIEGLKEEKSVNSAIGGVILKLLDHLISERLYQIYRGRLTVNNKPILSPQEVEVLRKATGLEEHEWLTRFQASPNTKTD